MILSGAALITTPSWGSPNLTGGSVSGQPGTTVSVPFTFDPTTASVAGIQFSLILPSGWSSGTVTSGAILNSAVKFPYTNQIGNTWTFIIVGSNLNTLSPIDNATAIPSGNLLTAQMTIPAGTAAGTYNITVNGVVYSDPSGNSVTPGAAPAITVTVSGAASPCDVNRSGGAPNVGDVQTEVNAILNQTLCNTTTMDLNQNGKCDVGDVQRIVNVILGGSCVIGP